MEADMNEKAIGAATEVMHGRGHWRVDDEDMKAALAVALPPLRARLTDEQVRQIAHKHTICMCEDKPGVFICHTNLCDGLRAAIRETEDAIAKAESAALPVAESSP